MHTFLETPNRWILMKSSKPKGTLFKWKKKRGKFYYFTLRSESCYEIFNSFWCNRCFCRWKGKIWYFIAGHIYWNILILILNCDPGIFVIINIALAILQEGLWNSHSRTDTSSCDMNYCRGFFNSLISENGWIWEIFNFRIHLVFGNCIRLSPKLVLRMNLRVTFKFNRHLRVAFYYSFRWFHTHDLLRLFSSDFMWSL